MQALVGATQQAQPRVLAAALPECPRDPTQAGGDDQRDQYIGQILPSRRTEADILEQVELGGLVVVEHPLVPTVVGGFPKGAQLRERGGTDGRQRAGKDVGRRLKPLNGSDPSGRHHRGRVYAHPAAPRKPDFRPGMGVTLPHYPETVHSVALAALVTGDDTRRNVQRAHQDHEGRRDVFAKAFFAVEPEFVGGVVAKYPWIEGVAVTATAQTLKYSGEQRFRRLCITRVTLHLRGQFQCARIESRWQLQIFLQARRAVERAMAKSGVADRPVAQQIGYRTVRHPLQLRRHAEVETGDHRFGEGRVQHKNPGAVVWLQRHLVWIGRSFNLQVGWLLPTQRQVWSQCCPFAAVE